MNRRAFLTLPLVSAAAVAQAKKPNVVIFLADDLGWADVGFHGSEIQTPNIDRLAAQGTQLNRFYSCPLCSPTRAALHTGKHPIRLGLGYTVIRPWAPFGLPAEESTIANVFHDAGYETAMAGKWHLGHFEGRYFPGKRGYDHSYGHFNGAIDYYTHEREGGIDWHRNGKALREEGYSTDLIANEAARHIRQRNKSKPLFLYVPFNAPHSPLQAPKEALDRYASIKDEKRRTFAAMTDRMDAGVGAVLKALDDQGIAGDTLVLFFSDNGGPTGLGARNTPLRGAKGSTWEGGTRVPAVVRFPGRIAAGAKSEQVMTVMDVLPTVAESAGIEFKRVMDGRSQWDTLRTGKTVPREDLFFSIESAQKFHFALHRADGPAQWKLVCEEDSKDAKRELSLFRLDQDATESNNLASANPGIVQELSARIDEWRKFHPANGLRHTGAHPAGWTGPKTWAP